MDDVLRVRNRENDSASDHINMRMGACIIFGVGDSTRSTTSEKG